MTPEARFADFHGDHVDAVATVRFQSSAHSVEGARTAATAVRTGLSIAPVPVETLLWWAKGASPGQCAAVAIITVRIRGTVSSIRAFVYVHTTAVTCGDTAKNSAHTRGACAARRGQKPFAFRTGRASRVRMLVRI